ncbi:MAG: ATP-binding cassette, subfamily er 3 [Alphaproteobacteria bacterium]|jgi:ATP-binding cassette subfamily F protein 3|nr:ATP-binding cassette, subfamily er 3 [Alphaproteobacteria bacterium]
MLVLDDISVRIAGKLLLDGATARIPDGARVGLVGRNGVGKTTLFRAIVGEIGIEHGDIVLSPRARTGRLAQEAPDGPESLLEVVLKADEERARLLADAETAIDAHRIAEIQTRLADIAAHSAPARAAEILAGLGFSHDKQQRPCTEFSGGWRMRVALAATLFAEPDLLLLDEPTNYLDLEGTLWLEDHLARYPRTVIVISHDRDLLDNAVDWIMHLEGGKLNLYRGGYTAFERQRRERQALDLKFAKRQETQRKHLQAFVDRFRAKATKARQAQSRLKLLAKLEPVTAVVADEVRPIRIPAPAKPLSPPIVALEDVAVGYEAGRPVLRRLNLRIDDDDRVALLGANGNGKSTLVKLLSGRLAAMAGRITRPDKLEVGYFAQHQLDELDPADSAFDHLRRLMPDAPEAKVRARAGAIGFPEAMADTPSGSLSGGEKSRLLLGLATFAGPHLVILDEPTNHLDIDSRAALISAINDYPGAVILVSHDRYLIEACADRLWLVADGGVAPFDGDLDDYRRFVLSDRGADRKDASRQSRSTDAPRAGRADVRRAAAQLRVELAPLRRRIADADRAVKRLTDEIGRLDIALAQPGLFARDPDKAAALAKARAEAVAALARAEDDWLAASTEFEAAMT